MALNNYKDNNHKTEVDQITAAKCTPVQSDSVWGRRIKYGLNISILTFSLIIILIIINWLVTDIGWRWDFTASRSYTISPQTSKLLDSLEDPLEITLLFSEADAGPLRRQVEDVLREYKSKSKLISIKRIDPTDTSALVDYQNLIAQLQEIYADEVSEYQTNIDIAEVALTDSLTFSRDQSAWLGEIMQNMSTTHPLRGMFESIYFALARMPLTGEAMLNQAKSVLETNASQAIPDWEGSAAIYESAISRTTPTINRIAELLDEALKSPDADAFIIDKITGASSRYTNLGDRLADITDSLRDLKPLGLTPIVRAIRDSNCVVIASGTKAVIVPFDELFMTPSAREMQAGQRLDLRFAGERVISSYIRQLLTEERPVVVLCHALPFPSITTWDVTRPDLGAVAERLTDLGFDVEQWNVQNGSKPDVEAGLGQVVWVMVPSFSTSMQDQATMLGNMALSRTAKELVDAGENVLFSFYPSMMPGMGQPDPWNEAAKQFDIIVDTGRVIFQQFPQAGGQDRNIPSLTLNDYNSEHPIGEALAGLDTSIDLPIPLVIMGSDESNDDPDTENAGTASSNINHWVLLEVKPDARLWAEDQWFSQEAVNPPLEVEKGNYILAIAAEKALVNGSQRSVFIGSGSWYYTGTVNRMVELGNNLWPSNPGNAELFTASVCWLAGLEDMIAPSAMTRTISRVDSFSPGLQLFYRWFLIAGIPVICLGIGIAVWMLRRG